MQRAEDLGNNRMLAEKLTGLQQEKEWCAERLSADDSVFV